MSFAARRCLHPYMRTTHIDEAAFRAMTEPHRRELEVHCYRMLGSVQDAEDVVQETFLAAWRGFDGFEGRSSFRTWLYRIATNRCLNALRDASRRPDETELPADPPEPTRVSEPLWLQPYPDDPDERYEAREAIGLAFVAGLQHLPPIQRATLVLRDVLDFRAAEVAEMLDTSPASVNSGLQRARAALETRVPPAERAPLPRSARERELVGRFADAFESGDVDAIVALLTDDAWLTMPPVPLEYQGPAAIGNFLATVPCGGELQRFRFVPTRANGQPAFGFYISDPHSPIAHASGILVLTLEGDRISAITVFHDTSVLPRFGLPRTLP
jgi:RNA polymerase sigma-70 factor (TIGR02960 family)